MLLTIIKLQTRADRQPIRLQKFYNLRRANDADWLSRAGIFKKWAHIWCQLSTKSDLITGINFSGKSYIFPNDTAKDGFRNAM